MKPSPATETEPKRKHRRLWLTVHLYLGLSLGLVFVLMGLTGSFLVFYTKIDNLLNPPTQAIQSTSPPSPQAIIDKLKASYPDREAGWRIELPMHPGDPVMARYLKPRETQGSDFAPLVVILDPATLDISSSRLWGTFASTWIYDLHYTLLLDTSGKTVLAILSIFILISLLSGIYLWWPQAGNFRSALTYRPHAHMLRRIYDWHKLAGLYGLIVLLMLTVTGIMLERPDWFEGMLGTKVGMQHMGSMPAPAAGSHPAPKASVSLDQMAQTALQQFPGSELRWIYTPDSDQGQYQFRLYQPGEPGHRFPKTIVWINHSGQVVNIRDYFADNPGDKIMNWLHPLHNGEALGLTGRWIIVISGLLPLVLFTTGFLRWRHKQQAANAIKDRKHRKERYQSRKKG
ncbi:PepSY domain-containing protein [Methylobacillus gramineus]|uniref:PepSY-associated TM helix domain-containing protein n=1 Tax=Methylobacillus gramineus TaxID=755169 RepID=UPI001CFF5FF2|nr:PepSY-associated TM helix domain-containing protein [Methylobacillus gramineus]MCB5186276.1 PepSY domain-containing protein [Methylobacillus gramineus]